MTAASGLAAWLRLTLIPGIGGESQRKLLAAFGLPEQIFAAGGNCAMRWTYTWVSLNGQAGRIRGVDIYRITGGLIAEKLSYVKG